MPETSFPSLEAFYDADPARRHSGEADYGVNWTNGPRWPTWRVSYVQATGEVYATQLGQIGGQGRVEVLGIVPPDQGGGLYYRTLDVILRGWADEPGLPISWVRERLEAYQEIGRGAYSGQQF